MNGSEWSAEDYGSESFRIEDVHAHGGDDSWSERITDAFAAARPLVPPELAAAADAYAQARTTYAQACNELAGSASVWEYDEWFAAAALPEVTGIREILKCLEGTREFDIAAARVGQATSEIAHVTALLRDYLDSGVEPRPAPGVASAPPRQLQEAIESYGKRPPPLDDIDGGVTDTGHVAITLEDARWLDAAVYLAMTIVASEVQWSQSGAAWVRHAKVCAALGRVSGLLRRHRRALGDDAGIHEQTDMLMGAAVGNRHLTVIRGEKDS